MGGKYDDLIGGGKIILDVQEVLNEESANKVDKKLKEQRAEAEKPIVIKADIDDSAALKKLKKLTDAVRNNRKALKGAISSGSDIGAISGYIRTHEQLEQQIQAVTKQVKNNNKAISSSKRALTDAKNLIDSLSVSLDNVGKKDVSKPIKEVAEAAKPKKATRKQKQIAEKQPEKPVEDKASIDTGVKATEKNVKATEKQVRTIEQVNAELDVEKKKLKEIGEQQEKNDAAFDKFARKRANYAKEVLGSNKAVYDAGKIRLAESALEAFNAQLYKRNQFVERYAKLTEIISQSFVGQYGIDNGLYGNIDEYIEGNSQMKQLQSLAKNGIKGFPTKDIDKLFSGVVRDLRSSLDMTRSLISSGDVLGVDVIKELDAEEISLGQERQRLYDAHEAQLTRVNDLRQEELDLIVKKGQAEAEATKQAEIAVVQLANNIRLKRIKTNGDIYDKHGKQIKYMPDAYMTSDGRFTIKKNNHRIWEAKQNDSDELFAFGETIKDVKWRIANKIYKNELQAAIATEDQIAAVEQSSTALQTETARLEQSTAAIEEKIEKTEELTDVTQKATKSQKDLQKAYLDSRKVYEVVTNASSGRQSQIYPTIGRAEASVKNITALGWDAQIVEKYLGDIAEPIRKQFEEIYYQPSAGYEPGKTFTLSDGDLSTYVAMIESLEDFKSQYRRLQKLLASGATSTNIKPNINMLDTFGFMLHESEDVVESQIELLERILATRISDNDRLAGLLSYGRAERDGVIPKADKNSVWAEMARRYDGTPQIETETKAIKANTQATKENTQAKKQNLGYHAGDLGKAERYSQFVYNTRWSGFPRNTGHFGTGTYFVGNPKAIEGYNSRNGVPAPVEQVDFSKYNLFKPSDTEQAREFHRTLQMINDDLLQIHKYDDIDLDFLQQAINDGNTEYLLSFLDKYLDEGARSRYEADVLNYKSTLENLDEDSIRSEIWAAQDELNKAFSGDLDDVWLIAEDIVEEELKRTLDENRQALQNFNLEEEIAQRLAYDIEHKQFEKIENTKALKNTLVDKLSKVFTDKTKEEISSILDETYRTISGYAENNFSSLDSASTVFMKQLGYEGIDVRHTDLDNTEYGSVIYDLKGEDLERRKEILRLQEKSAIASEKEAKAAEKHIEEVKSLWEFSATPSGQTTMFEGMSDAVDNAKELGNVLEEVIKIPGQIHMDEVAKDIESAAKSAKKLFLHAGYLGDIENTMPSFPLGHVAPTVNGSGISGLTGLYTIGNNPENVTNSNGFAYNEWHGLKISSIDPSFYKLFDATNEEIADKLGTFVSELHATIYGFARDAFTGDMIDVSTIKTVEELYAMLGELVSDINMDFEAFKKFVADSQAVVAGAKFEYHKFPSIDEGIAKSSVGYLLKGVSEKVFNSDSFGTQLLKQLGFEGYDVSGTKYDGTYTGGSVLFTIKPESIVARDENWSDVMKRIGFNVSEQDLAYEKKRQQLALDTAKAYRRPQLVAANPPSISSELEKFDNYVADIAVPELNSSEKIAIEFQRKASELRNKIAKEETDCETAYDELSTHMADFWESMQTGAEEATETVRKLSGKQRTEMFNGASFKKLFEQYHVSAREQDVIYDEINKLADMITSESDAGSIEAQKSQIISLIAKAAKLERETGLEDVFDALKSSKIYYDQSEIKEIGKNTWRDEKSYLSSMNLLTTSREKGSRADTYFDDLSEYVQGMVAEAFEKEHKSGFTGAKSHIIQGIAALIKNAPDRLVGVTGDEQDYVRGEAAGIIDKVIGNVRNLLAVEQGVSAELEEQNGIREEGAKITGNTPKPSGDGGPKLSGDNDGDDDEKRPSFIDTDIDTALKQLRTALHNKTDLIDLREVDTPDKLETQISNMAQEILKDSTKLSLGSVVAQGDVARITLYNKELGVTVSQVYKLQKAAEDAEDAIDGVDKATLQHMPDADVYKHDAKAAQAYSDAQQRQADKNDKWLIQQLTKLDKQELSYKYSSKKVDGNKSLINEDTKYAGETIEGLAKSIKERANNAMGGVLTEAVKNEITDSLRVLDHEIKVAQSEKYKKGVLSAQEVTEAKATNKYKLDAFEAKAKNNNIFTQLAEDIKKMRTELNGVTEQDSSGLDRFVDKFRTAEAKFKVEMTKQQGEKQEERDLQTVLNLQERLYEIKKKQAELEAKGELGTAEGQKVSRRAAELQEEYEASLALLKNTEDRNAAMQRQAQLEKEVGAVRAEQEAKQEAADKKNAEQKRAQQIEKYYQSVLETVNRINSIDSKINDLKFKDSGSGIYSGLIEQLESEKTALLGRIDQIGDAINQEFNGVFKSVGDLDKVSFSFDSLLKNTGAYGILLDFFNDTEVRATLATEKIDKFVQAIDKSQNIEFDFKSKINDQFDSVDKLVSKLKEINEALGDSSNLGGNARYQEIMQMFGVFEQLKAYGDENGWTAQGLAFFEQAAAQVSKYSNELIQATEQERKYFANKQKVSGGETYDDYTRPPSNELSTYVDNRSTANKLPGGDVAATQKQKLEEYIAAYSKGKGIITDFVKTANGVNKIEFSIIDETVGELRTFSAEMGQFSDNIYMTETTMKNLTGGTDAAKKAVNELVEAIARLNQMKAGGADVDVDGQIAKLEEKLQDLTSKLSSTGDSKDIGSQTAYKNLATDAQKALKDVAKLEQEWAKVQALLDDSKSGVKNLGTIDKAGKIYEQMFAKVKAAAGDATISNVKFDNATNTLTYTLTGTNKEVTEMVAKMHQLNGVVTTQQGQVSKLKYWWQDLGSSMGGIGKQTLQYVGNMLDVASIIQGLRKGFNAVLEIDTAMTELRKVTDETDATYQRFLQNMSKSGAVVGSTVKDLTTSAADWARLGYSIEEAGRLAENTMILMNVSEFDNVSEATETLISAIQAFRDENTDVGAFSMDIIDQFNTIGNSYAISTSDLADSLTRSSAALVAANNSLEQSVALTTAGNTIAQDPEAVGNALKTVSMRIRGVKTELEAAGEETEGMVTNTAKLQDKIIALTNVDGKGGINILTETGDFKSTYDILLSISKVWKEMDDTSQAALLELVAGKNRASIVSGIFQNGDILEGAYNDALNSDGSAMGELNKYLDSVQGKLDQLSNSTQTMWMNFMNADVLKWLISFANNVVKITDKVGILQVAMAAFAAKTAFNADGFGQFFKLDINEETKQIEKFSFNLLGATKNAKGLGIGAKAAAVGTQLLNSALTMGISLLASFVIGKALKWFDDFTHKAERAAEAAEKAINSYESTQKTLNGQKATIDELAASYKQLSKGVDLDDNTNINLSTSSYQKYLDVCNDIADMYPNLVTGFDAQGNAILSLKGNVDALTKSYKEAAQANRSKLIAEKDNIFSTFKNDYDDNASAFDDTVGLKQQLELAREFQSVISSGSEKEMKNFWDTYLATGSENLNALSMFKAAGIDTRTLGGLDVWKGDVIKPEGFEKASAAINSFILSTESKIETGANNIKTLMGAYLDDKSEYAKLNENTKSLVSTVISNLDSEFINGFESADDLWTWIDTNFVDVLEKSNLSQQISKELSDAFNFKAQLKNGEMPLDEYRTEILSFVDFVKNSGLKEEAQEQILQMFDIDLDKEDSIGAEIDEMLNYVNGIVDEKAKDKVMQLSYSDLQIINSDQFKVPEGTLLTWDQLQAKIKEVRIAATQDFTSDNFADYAESVGAISSNISTYQEALEKLESGTFSLTDFMELIAQFPDLADGVDMSSKSFNGLSKNLRKAIRNSPDDLVDELEDLRDQLVEAGKSTDHIDALIDSIENMPESAVKDLGEEYITLADQVDDAKRAVNELKEAMSENPNEGFETRGGAIEQMKTLMEGGQIGSESELWSIAEAFGFTYDSAKTINENADALYKFITAREKWYATDKDGNYTYKGTETAIEAIEKASQSETFKRIMNQQGYEGVTFKWNYEDGKLDFDFDNADWDKIVYALSQTKEAAGLTSDEFYDLLVQIGQFHEIDWEDPNDILDYLDKIAKGTDEPTEKLKRYKEAMDQLFGKNGKDADIDLSNRPIVGKEKMQESGWNDFGDGYATVYSSSYSNEDGTKTVVVTPILPNGEVLSPEELETYADKLLKGEELEPGIDIKLAEFNGEDSIKQASEYSKSLHEAQEQYQTLQDPLDIETTIANDGLKGLNEIADLQGTIQTNSEGTTVLDTDAFSAVLKDVGYTEEQINSLITKIKEYENVVAVTNNDPLGLNNTDVSIDSVVSSLEYFGIKYNEIKGATEGDPITVDVNATDLITKLQEKGWTREQIIAYLQTLSSEENGLGITINGQVNMSTDEIDAAIEKANAVPETETTEYTVTGTGQDAAHDIKDTWSDVPKTVTTTYNVERNETTTKRVDFVGGGGGHYPMVNGTAHAQGTSGSWGAPENTESLVGELGPELRVRGNEWTLVGQNGAEFTDVRKGDIIFNHKQTEDLLKNGYVTGRGKAYASGTAFASGSGSYKKYTFYDTENSKSASKLSKAAKDISKSSKQLSDDFKEIFDWIEVRIEEITEDLDLKGAKLENAVGSKKQNAIIDDMIELNQALYSNLLAGANKYYEYAKKLLEKVPAEYREAAQNGAIAIESFVGKVGDKTLTAIQDYREWVQKGADATQQAEETLTEISSLAKQAIDNIATDYENKKSLRDNKIDQYEAYNSLLETDVGYESGAIYQAMIKENNKNIELLSEQRNKMLAELNKRVESGEIKKNSQDWYDAVNDIAAVDTEIIELKTDVEDYQDAINELHWEHFDNFVDKLQAVSDEAENLIDILSNKDLVDEDGNWTKEGITSLGLYAQQMENAEMQAKQYQEEINYLNKNWKKLGYTEQEYFEKLDELKDGQYDAIEAYHDTKDAIVDLNSERVDAIKNGIEREIESYEKLISAKKEELDAEKD